MWITRWAWGSERRTVSLPELQIDRKCYKPVTVDVSALSSRSASLEQDDQADAGTKMPDRVRGLGGSVLVNRARGSETGLRCGVLHRSPAPEPAPVRGAAR